MYEFRLNVTDSGNETSSDYDVIPLSGAGVKLEKNYKLNKHVIRVVTCKQLFFGFESIWERNVWRRWMDKVSVVVFVDRNENVYDRVMIIEIVLRETDTD